MVDEFLKGCLIESLNYFSNWSTGNYFKGVFKRFYERTPGVISVEIRDSLKVSLDLKKILNQVRMDFMKKNVRKISVGVLLKHLL